MPSIPRPRSFGAGRLTPGWRRAVPTLPWIPPVSRADAVVDCGIYRDGRR